MSEICTIIETNVNQGVVKSYGKISGMLVSAKKPDPIAVSAVALKATFDDLMLQDLNDGRIFILKDADAFEPGSEEAKTATSENGDFQIGKTQGQHKFTFYTDDSGTKSLLKAFGSGMQVYVSFLTRGNYIRAKKNTDGQFEFVKCYIQALAADHTDNSTDAVTISVTVREDFKQNQLSIKPDFELSELSPIATVVFSEGSASAATQIVTFNANYESGCIATDFTIGNVLFTVNGTLEVPTQITNTAGVISATFALATFIATDTIGVYLSAPSVSNEFYETAEIYEITAGA